MNPIGDQRSGGRKKDMEKKLRRSQVSLVTLGAGVILFGLWSVIKSLLYFRTGLFDDLDTQVEPEQLLLVKLITVGLVALIVFADLGFRLKIGLRARAEGMGRRQKSGHLVLAALIVLFNLAVELLSISFVVKNGLSGQSYIEYAVSMLVDLSSTVLLIELIVTVLRVRKLSALSEG